MSTATATVSAPVVGLTKHEKAKAFKRAHAAPNVKTGEAKPPVKPPIAEAKHKGAVKITQKLTPEQLREEIDMLLDDLRTCTDGDEKKTIRRKLRLRGHFGGLGEKKAEPAKADAKK